MIQPHEKLAKELFEKSLLSGGVTWDDVYPAMKTTFLDHARLIIRARDGEMLRCANIVTAASNGEIDPSLNNIYFEIVYRKEIID